MVSIMENVRYGGFGGSVSDFTYRQQVERIQQEEQYRQEMMRQRQELHRRQMDLYQRLQVPQYLSQDTHSVGTVGSTWSQPKLESRKAEISNSSFGPAPQVRNPSGRNVFNSLTVDCSVEYELPEHLKVSSKDEKVPAIVIMKKQTSKSCSVSGCTACKASCPSSMAGGMSPKQRMRALVQAKSKSSSLNQSSFPTPQKISSKRKFYEMEKQEIVSKRQKMATLMTPPDMMSASYFLESPTTVFQPSVPSFTHNMFHTTPTSSMFQTRTPQPQFQSVYPPMYPLHGYTTMYPQYSQTITCQGCIQGICPTI